MLRGSCSMLAGTGRGLAVAIVTEGLTSLAASPGSQSMLNPGCRSCVSGCYQNTWQTEPSCAPHTALSPRSPAPPLPWAPPGAGTPPAHISASTCPPSPGWSPHRPWCRSAQDGRERVTMGLVAAPCRFPCGPQMGPAVPSIPVGAGSQHSPHGASSARSPLALVCKAPIKDC